MERLVLYRSKEVRVVIHAEASLHRIQLLLQSDPIEDWPTLFNKADLESFRESVKVNAS